MSTLGLVLRASLDPSITTEALRIYFGIVGRVWAQTSKPDGDGVAYISLDSVYVESGVTPKAVSNHLPELERLGIRLIEGGGRGQELDGHGVAGAWDTCPSDFTPMDLGFIKPTLLNGVRRFLDPAGTNWERSRGASAGWRASAVLLATHGLHRASITASWLAGVLEVHRSNASAALNRMDRVGGLVTREGRAWVWDPSFLIHDIQMESDLLTDNRPLPERIRRYNARRHWLGESRPAWVAEKRGQAEKESALRRVASDRVMDDFLASSTDPSGLGLL